MSRSTALSAAAVRFPTRAAIRFFGRAITYRELETAANRFANALLGLGVARGDQFRCMPSPSAVRGPQVMRRYWKRPDETARALRDGWLFTGDLASVDTDGYFSVVDRKKSMIITGGMNVYPRDVEEPLYQHPHVKEAVAVGIPDERWGEAVKVYIVLRDGESATAQEIVDFCHSRMARYKVPKFVEFRPELPKNMIGKVLRRRLLEEELASSTVEASRAS